jgi:pyrroline-5-carboxylate reductase
MSKKIGFIGAGNMAGAIIKGLIANQFFSPEDISASVSRPESLSRLESIGIFGTLSSEEVIKRSDVVVIAVKPHILRAILPALKPHFSQEHLIISIAAGVTIDELKGLTGQDRIVRTMPNTAALVGASMTSLCSNLSRNSEDCRLAESVFNSVGRTEWIEERQIHAATAVHGSSPAYVYLFIEAMADAAVLGGIPRAQAYKMAAQTLYGASKLMLETELHPGVLKDQVTSPGGTTIEALAVLEAKGFRSAVIEAMRACIDKSEALSKQ